MVMICDSFHSGGCPARDDVYKRADTRGAFRRRDLDDDKYVKWLFTQLVVPTLSNAPPSTINLQTT